MKQSSARTDLLPRLTIVWGLILAFGVVPLPGIFKLGMLLLLPALIKKMRETALVTPPIVGMGAIALVGLSILWSDAPASAAVVMRTYLPVLITVTVALSMLRPEGVLWSLRVFAGATVGSSLIYILLSSDARNGDYGSSSLILTGQFPKNAFGLLLAFSLALVLARARINWFALALLLTLIALNRSVTAWTIALALLLARVLVALVARRTGLQGARAAACVAVLASSVLTFLFIAQFQTQIFGLVGRDPTLTQRTQIWTACIDAIGEAPVLGYGAFSFLFAAADPSPVTLKIWSGFSSNYLPPHPHNAWLDVTGQFGIVGLCLVLGVLLKLAAASVRLLAVMPEIAASAALILVMMTVGGATETTLTGPWLIILVAVSSMLPLATHAASHLPLRSPREASGDPGVARGDAFALIERR